MNANELRLGNYLFNGQSYVKVIEITKEDVVVDLLPNSPAMFENCDIKPIPLTGEWLVKFGFKIFKDKTYLFKNWTLDLDGNIWVINTKITTIKYVHSLQNLYFALTGEELEIKE